MRGLRNAPASLPLARLALLCAATATLCAGLSPVGAATGLASAARREDLLSPAVVDAFNSNLTLPEIYAQVLTVYGVDPKSAEAAECNKLLASLVCTSWEHWLAVAVAIGVLAWIAATLGR